MFDLRLVADDGESMDVHVDSRDVYAWERTNKARRTLGDMGEKQSMSDMYGLGYRAAKRLGLFTGTEVDFCTTYAIEDFEQSDDDADPTQPEA